MDQSKNVERTVEGTKVPSLQPRKTNTFPQSSNGPKITPSNAQPSRPEVRPIESKDQLAKAEEEILKLREEKKSLIQEQYELTADLEQCKAELFAWKPPSQISDDSIQKDLERIRQSIDSFVYDAMVDVEDDALYHFCEKQYQKYKKQKGKNRSRLGKFIKTADISAWGQYGCSNFYILSVILEWILDEYIFLDRYPKGITGVQKETIRDVENGMRYPSQGKGQLSIDRWKSETLTALIARRESDSCLTDASNDIISKVRRILSDWMLDAGSSVKLESRFQRDILDPAIRLHQNLRSSSHEYTIEPIQVLKELSPAQMLNEWVLKDADEWRQVKKENRVGKALYCLHPPLLRHQPNGGAPIVIVKPVIVVVRPGKESMSKPHSRNNTLSDGTTTPPAAIRSASVINHLLPSLDQDISLGGDLADSPYVSMDCGSDTSSTKRLYRLDEERSPAEAIEKEQEHLPRSRLPQASLPAEPFPSQHDLSEDSRYYHDEERQYSGRPREDQYGQSPLRYQVNQDPPQHGDPRPYRRGSRDTAGEKTPQRRPVNDTPHHPITPSSSVPSSPASTNRGTSIFFRNPLPGITGSFTRKPKQ